MTETPDNHLELTTSTKLTSAITWVLDDAGDAGELLDSDGNEHHDVAAAQAILKDYAANEDTQRAALQRLLEGMHSRGQTHGEDGSIFDSIEAAAHELVAAGGSLDWYPDASPTP